MSAPASCGWCLSHDHEHCRPSGDGWTCACAARGHAPKPEESK